MVLCRECTTLSLPAVVLDHAARSAEVAIRTGTVAIREPSEAEQRAARTELREQKSAALDDVREVIEAFDPDGLSEPIARQARVMQRKLEAYLPEIQAAPDLGTLAAVERDIEAIGQQAQRSGLVAMIERHREVQERATERAEWEQQEAARAERERGEQERQEQQRQRQLATQRQALPAVPQMSPRTQAMAHFALMVKHSWERKQNLIQQCGRCEFNHPWAADGIPATRRYVGSRIPGQAVQGAPETRACDKHHKAAEQWLTRQGWVNQTFFELPEPPPRQPQTQWNRGFTLW